MLDVHPPHHPTHTWADFFVHIATITVGLLIAIGLEQTVEAFHHRHQRHQLEEDLREEASRNRDIILRDLVMEKQIAWFHALAISSSTPAKSGPLTFTMPATPCKPGYIGTVEHRYFAPSEAVWTTAKESGLTALIPAEEARIYARVSHNDDLLAITRDHMAVTCERVLSLQNRFATLSSDGQSATWALTPEHADRTGDAASDAEIALRALLSRLCWTLIYEEAIEHGAKNSEQLIREANQKDFEK